MDSVATLNLKDIRENPVALRQVNKKSEAYIGLVDSIKEVGLLNPILVRPDDSQPGVYTLIDGLHRFSACCDAGLETIPVQIKAMEDGRALEAQIIGNIHKVETKPVEYSKQLQRLLAMNPALTSGELAAKLAKSTSWIDDRLSLTKLHETIKKQVDEGRINLTNAYSLAKLEQDEQLNWVDKAMTLTPKEFGPMVIDRKKEIDKAKRAGRVAAPAEFRPTAYIRKLGELKAELENATVGPKMVEQLGLSKKGVDAFAAAVRWCLSVDDDTVAKARADYEKSQQEVKERKDRAAAERTERKAQKAQVLAARAQVEAEAAKNKQDVEAALKAFDAANGLVDGKFTSEK